MNTEENQNQEAPARKRIVTLEIGFNEGGHVDVSFKPSEDAPPTMESLQTVAHAQILFHFVHSLVASEGAQDVFNLIRAVNQGPDDGEG